MSKILKRPMFRKGGEVTEGIVSMAAPRKNYQDGPGPNSMDEDRLAQQAQRYANIAAKIYGPTAPSIDPAARALIDFGTKYMAARPVGGGGLKGLLTTAAKPGSEAAQLYFSEMDKQDAANRQLKMFGLQQAFGENLARLKAKTEYAPDKLKDPARRYMLNIERLQKVYGSESSNLINAGKLKNDQIKFIAANDVLQNLGKAPAARISFASLSKGTITDPEYLDPKTNMPKKEEFQPGKSYVNPDDGSTWLYEGQNKFKKIFEIKADDYELLRKL